MTDGFLRQLEVRRKELGMSMNALAKRSGVSLANVKRTLSGRQTGASFEYVVALATVLGVDIELGEAKSAQAVVQEGAMEKAQWLVAIVQGSSGLDGHAVAPEKRDRLIKKAFQMLMAGPRRRIWSD